MELQNSFSCSVSYPLPFSNSFICCTRVVLKYVSNWGEKTTHPQKKPNKKKSQTKKTQTNVCGFFFFFFKYSFKLWGSSICINRSLWLSFPEAVQYRLSFPEAVQYLLILWLAWWFLDSFILAFPHLYEVSYIATLNWYKPNNKCVANYKIKDRLVYSPYAFPGKLCLGRGKIKEKRLLWLQKGTYLTSVGKQN